MAITKKDFIQRVLLIMNEAGLYDAEGIPIGADTAQIDRYIEGSFVEAWRRMCFCYAKGVVTEQIIYNGRKGRLQQWNRVFCPSQGFLLAQCF